MSFADHWDRLGIAPTDDRREIKRAYARALKTIDVDADPQSFIRLRHSLEEALVWGAEAPAWDEETETDDWQGEDDPAAHELADSIVFPPAWEAIADEFPPALPECGVAELDAVCAALDRALSGEENPDPALVAALGSDILSHPALDAVDCANRIEHWLAEAIAAGIPRSDPLIEPTVARFGWRVSGFDWNRSWALRQVMQRRADLAFLARCMRSHDVHSAAMAELRTPPRRRLGLFGLQRIGDVEGLLRLIENDHPTIVHDLDPRTLAWWRKYLSGPRPPASFWPSIILVPTLLALGVWFSWEAKTGRPPSLLLIYLLALAGFGAAMFIDAVLRAGARRRAAEASAAPRLPDLWPIGFLLALPPAVTLLPDRPWAVAVSCALAVTAAIAALSRLWIARPRYAGDSRYFLPLMTSALALAMLVDLPVGQALKLLPPIAALCWAGVECKSAVALRLLAIPAPFARLPAAAALIAALATSGLNLWAMSVGYWPGWLIVSAPVVVIFVHLAVSIFALPAGGIQVFARLALWIVMMVTVNFGFHNFDRLYSVVALIALASAALRAVAALRVR